MIFDTRMMKAYECIVTKERKSQILSVFKLKKSEHIPYRFNLIESVKNPMVVKSKKDGILFNIGFVNYTSINSYVPLTMYTRLIFQYDNEYGDKKLIEKFENKFKEYSYILYTTINHKKSCPSFVVIVKLDSPISVDACDDLLVSSLVCKFNIDNNVPDSVCVDNKTMFYLPQVMEERKGIYYYKVNKGKRFPVSKVVSMFKYPSINEKLNVFDSLPLAEETLSKVHSIDITTKYIDPDYIRKIKNRNFKSTSFFGKKKELFELFNTRTKRNFNTEEDCIKAYAKLCVEGCLNFQIAYREFSQRYPRSALSKYEHFKDYFISVVDEVSK